MALRSLLRRIPVRPPSGPLMGPGISPAAPSRFMATGEQRLSKELVELHEKEVARRWESIKANSEEAMKAHAEIRSKQAVMVENVRREMDDLARYGRKWRVFLNASAAAMVASTGLLAYWAHEAL